MAIEVNIQPEDINEQIAQAVLDSAIGKHIDGAIKKALEASGFNRENIVEAAVRDQVRDEVRKLVSSETFQPKIEAFVREKLSDNEALQKIWDAGFGKLLQADRGY